ncbi:MAG: oligosaccharide flippase family protein [Candidatus Woykebacteria bacterium]
MFRDLIKISTNTLSQLVAKSVTTTSTLAITLLVTHNLSKSDWGVFVTITSYVALFYLISDFGLNGIVTRELVKNEEKISEYFNRLFSLRIVLSVITIFVALAVLSFTNHSNFIKLGIIISLTTVFTLAVFNSAVAIFQANLRYDQAALADVSGAIITLVLAYLFIISQLSIIFVVVAYVVGGVVRACLSLILVRSQTKQVRLDFDLPSWRQMILASLPIGVTLIFSQVAANIDKQVVYLANYDSSLSLNNELAAGYYGLAYRVFEFGIILPAFFVNSIYPFLIRDQVKDLRLLRENFFKYGKLLVVASFLVTLAVFFLGSKIVLIFGDFAPAAEALKILSLSYPFFYLTPLLMWTIITLGREKLLPFVYGFAALVNLAANIYFVPKFGFVAASLITVFTEILILLWLFALLKPLFAQISQEENEDN